MRILSPKLRAVVSSLWGGRPCQARAHPSPFSAGLRGKRAPRQARPPPSFLIWACLIYIQAENAPKRGAHLKWFPFPHRVFRQLAPASVRVTHFQYFQCCFFFQADLVNFMKIDFHKILGGTYAVTGKSFSTQANISNLR